MAAMVGVALAGKSGGGSAQTLPTKSDTRKTKWVAALWVYGEWSAQTASQTTWPQTHLHYPGQWSTVDPEKHLRHYRVPVTDSGMSWAKLVGGGCRSSVYGFCAWVLFCELTCLAGTRY